MKFAWHNSKSFEEADVILFGVPDETGSHALRQGVSKAPDAVRRVSSEREIFERKGEKIVALPETFTLNKKIFDYGNVIKRDVADLIEKILAENKIPVCIGGDHSITAEILKGIDKVKEKISVVYIDSHPDFICSDRKYYGSVVCDITEYKNIDFKSSIELGIRVPEPEELKSIRRTHLKTLTTAEIEEKGLEFALQEVKKRVGKNIYVSLDMDVVDPAFAPGVSIPNPAGLTSTQIVYLMKEIAKIGIIGFDVMEVCPTYDIQDMTSHLAVKIIIETISSIKT